MHIYSLISLEKKDQKIFLLSNFQIDLNAHFGVKGSEDCLVVSVYTPRINQPLLPVFVWLHGNDFHKGSGNADLHGPNRIMDYDVVILLTYLNIICFGKMSE